MNRRYCWYICRHKWFVFLACCRLGIPFAGIVHDLSKFRPSEFVPYARFFYGRPIGDNGKPLSPSVFEQFTFDYAWLLHIHRNPHHYQFYILKEDSGETKVLEMPERYIREMVADWRGAGRAIQGRKSDARAWYLGGKDKKVLAPNTRRRVEQLLGIA